MGECSVTSDIYITYFPSCNGRKVELYKKSNGYFQYIIKLDDKTVAVANKYLAFKWLYALVKPEYYSNVQRLYMDL